MTPTDLSEMQHELYSSQLDCRRLQADLQQMTMLSQQLTVELNIARDFIGAMGMDQDWQEYRKNRAAES